MRRPSLFFFALTAVPIGIAVAASNEACKEKTDVPSDPPLVIGASVDLTKQKDFGAGSQRVLRVAEQQLNAVGGILGRRVIIDIRDDGGDNKSIGGIGEDLLKKKVAGFIGPSTTEALEVIHGPFRVAKTPILSPLTTSPSVPLLQQGRDRYVFRTSCAVEYQSRAIARYALGGSFAPPGGIPDAGVTDSGSDSGPKDAGTDAKDAGKTDAGGTPDAGTPPPAFKACTKMAAIYTEDSPGAGSATIKSLAAEYGKFGGTLKQFVVSANAASYENDVAKVVASARAGEIDCQTFLLFPGDGGKFMREFRRVTQGDPAFAADRFLSFGFIRFYQQGFIEAGRVDPKNTAEISQVEGVLGSACNQQRTTSPEWTRFHALYEAQFPDSLDAAANLPSPIPQIYDSVILLALAIEKAGSLDDKEAIRDALYSVSAPPGDAFGPAQLAEALEAVRLGRDIDYVGASGSFDLDDQGDTALEVIMWKVQGNGFVTIPGLDPAQLRQ